MSDARVILTTFAGRRDRMQILLSYAREAIDRGVISEYHIWNYARTAVDRKWVDSLSEEHAAIRVLTPRRERFACFYDYYDEDHFADAVFIKADDDIVYLDLETLPHFIEHRLADPEVFLLSANVVNNGVCAYFQQQEKAIPPELMELPYPAEGLCGKLWESAQLATRLHCFFLGNLQRFSAEGTTPAPHRLSINFVSYLGRDLKHIRGLRGDDEHELSVAIPGRLGRENRIYNGFVVSHLSFSRQEKDMPVAELLDEYRALAATLAVTPWSG